ncbi:hypothetical protein ElyMa_001302200 [Elysia marginata]|uniref:Uncharacterized protein n=1 Tax=Elysia marginata TaxID=1093978 RepID=A0AAV4ILD6_9GAST|nr:hypothetical protein ElyMa_001302200 [Elysia marginata]
MAVFKKKDCTAKITTGSGSLDILHGCTIHSHERDVKKIQTHTLRQACKRRAAEDTCERPRKILVSEARRDETSIQRVDDRDMGNIRRAMWFERRKVLPKVPTNRKEALTALEGIQPRDEVIIIIIEHILFPKWRGHFCMYSFAGICML